MTRGASQHLPADEPKGESSAPAQEADPETEDAALIYRGQADVFEHGSLRIRPGQPVTVPSDVAEELLTFPHELFEVVASQE